MTNESNVQKLFEDLRKGVYKIDQKTKNQKEKKEKKTIYNGPFFTIDYIYKI